MSNFFSPCNPLRRVRSMTLDEFHDQVAKGRFAPRRQVRNTTQSARPREKGLKTEGDYTDALVSLCLVLCILSAIDRCTPLEVTDFSPSPLSRVSDSHGHQSSLHSLRPTVDPLAKSHCKEV